MHQQIAPGERATTRGHDRCANDDCQRGLALRLEVTVHEIAAALTIPEAAQKPGVSRSTVYRLINDGVLAAVSVRCVLRVRPKDIERYLDHQQRIQRERLVRL